MSIKLSSYNSFLLVCLVAVINVSFLPFISLGMALYPVIGLLLLLLLSANGTRVFKKMRLLKEIWIILCGMLCYLLIAQIIYSDVDFSDIKSYMFATACLIIFTSCPIDDEHKVRIILFMGWITIAVSYMIILYYYNGDIVSALQNAGVYFYPRKNSFSPLLMVTCVYFAYFFFFKRHSVLIFLSIITGIIGLIILQSRTNLLAVAVGIMFLLLVYVRSVKDKGKLSLISFVFCLVVVLIIYNIEHIFSVLGFAFRLDYISSVGLDNFLDNFTSGRFMSLQYTAADFVSSPIFGSFFNSEVIASNPASRQGLHIVALRVLFYGGIILAIPFILFVIKLFILLRNRTSERHLINVFILVGFVMSIGEPFAPFGPTTNYILFWIIVSLYIQFPDGKTTTD
jgi:hypothetical protein